MLSGILLCSTGRWASMTQTEQLSWVPPRVSVTSRGEDLILENPITLADHPRNLGIWLRQNVIWRWAGCIFDSMLTIDDLPAILGERCSVLSRPAHLLSARQACRYQQSWTLQLQNFIFLPVQRTRMLKPLQRGTRECYTSRMQ